MTDLFSVITCTPAGLNEWVFDSSFTGTELYLKGGTFLPTEFKLDSSPGQPKTRKLFLPKPQGLHLNFTVFGFFLFVWFQFDD